MVRTEAFLEDIGSMHPNGGHFQRPVEWRPVLLLLPATLVDTIPSAATPSQST